MTAVMTAGWVANLAVVAFIAERCPLKRVAEWLPEPAAHLVDVAGCPFEPEMPVDYQKL